MISLPESSSSSYLNLLICSIIFGFLLAYSYLCTRYGTTDRDNTESQKKRISFGDERDCKQIAEPDVRVDMETIFNRLVPENRPEYEHTLEGADDMPAHAKSTLSGVSITIPITEGRLNLGTWQGIYFCEYRNYGGSREFVVTIIGE